MFPPRERAAHLDVAKLPVFDVAAMFGGPAEAEKRGADCQLDSRTIVNSASVRK
jgi:hypothetical protein